MKSRLTPSAERDIEEALAWYESKSEFLGDDFLRKVTACINDIERNPKMYRTVYRQMRRALVRVFPFQIIYEIEQDEIVVYSVQHAARNPKRWKNRSRRK